MARRRKGRAVNGILLLDKPAAVSSNHVMQRVRGLYRAQKAGHGGTLDPFATGLLPVLLGEATKFGRFLLDADKTYTVTLAFGEETDSDDHTGTVIRQAALPSLNGDDWAALLARFRGTQMQTPPIYSALKIGGERAYALARKGELPEMTPRSITIHELTLLAHDATQATLRVRCSKGTYIRALVRDIGRAAHSAAHAVALRRERVGNLGDVLYGLETLVALREAEDMVGLDALLLPLDACVQGLPTVVIPADKLRFFCHGNDVTLRQVDDVAGCAFYHDGRLLGVGRVVAGRAYPERLCALGENNNEEPLP